MLLTKYSLIVTIAESTHTKLQLAMCMCLTATGSRKTLPLSASATSCTKFTTPTKLQLLFMPQSTSPASSTSTILRWETYTRYEIRGRDNSYKICWTLVEVKDICYGVETCLTSALYRCDNLYWKLICWTPPSLLWQFSDSGDHVQLFWLGCTVFHGKYFCESRRTFG